MLRAFGTKCHFLLTVQKKGGRKLAVEAKGRLGIVIGIEDHMPAYRVLDIEYHKVRRIPFAQLITHEGHYPFRNYDLWTDEEKKLPASFTPTPDTLECNDELSKYNLSDEQFSELYFIPHQLDVRPAPVHPSTASVVPQSSATVYVPAPAPPPHVEPPAEPPAPVAPAPAAGDTQRYSLRESRRPNYNPPRQIYRERAQFLVCNPDCCMGNGESIEQYVLPHAAHVFFTSTHVSPPLAHVSAIAPANRQDVHTCTDACADQYLSTVLLAVIKAPVKGVATGNKPIVATDPATKPVSIPAPEPQGGARVALVGGISQRRA